MEIWEHSFVCIITPMDVKSVAHEDSHMAGSILDVLAVNFDLWPPRIEESLSVAPINEIVGLCMSFLRSVHFQ